jgi:hypothetical protein
VKSASLQKSRRDCDVEAIVGGANSVGLDWKPLLQTTRGRTPQS